MDLKNKITFLISIYWDISESEYWNKRSVSDRSSSLVKTGVFLPCASGVPATGSSSFSLSFSSFASGWSSTRRMLSIFPLPISLSLLSSIFAPTYTHCTPTVILLFSIDRQKLPSVADLRPVLIPELRLKVCLKMNLPRVIPKPHFLSPEKHKMSYLAECPSCSFPFNEKTGKSIKTVPLHKTRYSSYDITVRWADWNAKCSPKISVIAFKSCL